MVWNQDCRIMLRSINTLNGEYQDYFLKHEDEIAGHFKLLEQYLLDHKCTFKDRAMPTLMRPNFISLKQSGILADYVVRMTRALTKFIDLYLTDDHVKNLMGFSHQEKDLFSIDPGYSNPLVISRLDAFLSEYALKFLEFNCDSPAGIAYADVLEDGFQELFKMYPFLEDYRIRYARRQNMLLKSLLTCYGEFRDTHHEMPEKPVMAIVDWADVSTYSEFELHQKHFRENGIETVIASPQDFNIKEGRALIKGQQVHLVYKRVITRELLEKWEDVGPFIDCIRDGLVCCCNSFRSYIVGNKKVLSVITDPQFNYIFTPEENALIRETIPWTRVVADSEVSYRGERVNLSSFIPSNKDILVLKPGNMYGGRDVHIGRLTDQTTWDEIMYSHLHDDSWVVQEYVDIPQDQYPEISDKVKFKSKYVNINPFALLGQYCGTITRISDNQVINVSAGGGLVPTLTAECMI